MGYPKLSNILLPRGCNTVSLSRSQILFFQNNPVAFMDVFLGAKLWPKQQEIAMAMATHNKVTVRSCHGSGKTYLAAGLVCWYMVMFPDSRVITTAPGDRQVKEILWPEIHRMVGELKKRVSDVGELTTKKWTISPYHYALGMATDDPNAFQGIHEENLMIIFDEACGIPDVIYDSAGSCLTAPKNKALLIGNPTHPNTYFHRTHTGDVPGYARFKISAFETPNVYKDTDGTWKDKDPLPFPKLVTMSWIENRIKEHGKMSADVIARVYGEFPDSAEDQLIDGKNIAVAIKKGVMLRTIMKLIGEDRKMLSSYDIAKITGEESVN